MCLKLQGGIATIPQVICGTRRGPTLAYLPALALQREVWLSSDFRSTSSAMAQILEHLVLNSDHSTWSIIHSPDEFEYAKREANAKKHNSKILAVVTETERALIIEKLPAFISRHVFTLTQLLEFAVRVDRSNWRTGIH